MFEQVLAEDDLQDAIEGAVADLDGWLTSRGWVLDTDITEVISWWYPPSAAHFDNADAEPVTRLWITLDEDEDEAVLEFGAVLVGFAVDDDPYVLDPDALTGDIEALEAYRPGQPRPVLS
jgi:hypothetical protein